MGLCEQCLEAQRVVRGSVVFRRVTLGGLCVAALLPSVRRPLVAIVSSRTGRIYRRDHPWLTSLRFALRALEAGLGTLITVKGTTVHRWILAVADVLALDLVEVTVGQRPEPGVGWACRTGVVPVQDAVLWGLADWRFVLRVRRGGAVSWFLREAGGVVASPPARSQKNVPHRSFALRSRSAAVFPVGQLPDGGYLFHWTRDQPGPWPLESARLRCRRLLLGTDDFTALGSLRRIASMGHLLPGTGGYVSLTGVHPARWPELRRYRAHRGRWDFELYGVAVPLSRVVEAGGFPVVYVPAEYRDFLGKAGTQPDEARYAWVVEREWRVPGPLWLGLPGEVFLVARRRCEASALARQTGWPCAFYEEG